MELFYREYGKGTPLVILHGILGISDNWVSFGRKLGKQGYHIIIPDQCNHGKSPHNRAFNYYALTDDLHELIERTGLDDPVIMGHSMGGKVAMRYTLENPEAVSKLIIVDTSLRTYVRVSQHHRLIDAMMSVNFRDGMGRSEVEDVLSQTIHEKRILQFLMKNLYWKQKNLLGWRLNLEAISLNLESMYDGIFYSTRFDKPALFIRGGKSDYVLDTDIPAIMENFPLAEIKTIDKGTHWVHADEPAVFLGMVLDFLGDDN